jgi:acetyl-CoA carboxylase biotin carboxyl carrier protein
MNLNEIQDLIKFVSKAGVSEVEIEKKDFKIVIKSESKKEQIFVQAPPQMVQSTPVQQITTPPVTQTPAVAEVTAPKSEDSKIITVKSPMIGTFYRSTAPDKDPFVQVGDTIQKGSPVCIIEAMKLFNEIESEISGKIVKVLVDDATPVEYDQPLFLVDPS